MTLESRSGTKGMDRRGQLKRNMVMDKEGDI
jgi:hypothetical protein